MPLNRKLLSTLVLLLSTLALTAQKTIALTNPPSQAEVFAVSTGFSERDFAVSPDGTEIYYTLQSPQGVFQTIVYCKKEANNSWSKPEIAPFAGKFSDLEPAFSADGKKLYFASNRPTQGTTPKDFDIWVVSRENGQWGEPQNLGAPVNSDEDEFYPSIARNGNLYYTAAYKTAIGKEDIFVAKLEQGKYTQPVPLDTAVNSKMYEFNAFVSPDEDYIIFTSYGRKDDKGRGDLYMSIKDATGKWLPARNLSMLNSNRIDYCPYVSPDKKIMFFTSERISIPNAYTNASAKMDDLLRTYTSPQNGSGDIYWVSFDKVMEIWKK
ncbi:TolB family protein [Emticicia sp. BO119]|uniref:TolB family protein n=1 Tax=Emticicia sp. BO119 TaxID=2757768 RepID=UPI0015F06D7D|nr:PD40 domain-containing protein [Emticicia sp. BO119]MBA4851036.1 PD40 domain-containing protein [Emticicia sp. BO119]